MDAYQSDIELVRHNVANHQQCEFCGGFATRLVMRDGFRVCMHGGLCVAAVAFQHMITFAHGEDSQG
jgi:hypothetical protein